MINRRLIGILLFWAVIITPGCQSSSKQNHPETSPVTTTSLALDGVDHLGLKKIGVQLSDLPGGYELTVESLIPEEDDLPEDTLAGMAGYSFIQYDLSGNMAVGNQVITYSNESAAASAFKAIQEKVKEYQDELNISGLDNDAIGREERFQVGPMVVSNGSFAFRSSTLIATFTFINQSGTLDQNLINSVVHAVFDRARNFNP